MRIRVPVVSLTVLCTGWPTRAVAQRIADHVLPDCLHAEAAPSAVTVRALIGEFDVYMRVDASTPDTALWLESRLAFRRVTEGTVDFGGIRTLPMLVVGAIRAARGGAARESTQVLVPDAVFADSPETTVSVLREAPRGHLFRWTHDEGIDFGMLRLTPPGFAGRWSTLGSYISVGHRGDFCAIRRP